MVEVEEEEGDADADAERLAMLQASMGRLAGSPLMATLLLGLSNVHAAEGDMRSRIAALTDLVLLAAAFTDSPLVAPTARLRAAGRLAKLYADKVRL